MKKITLFIVGLVIALAGIVALSQHMKGVVETSVAETKVEQWIPEVVSEKESEAIRPPSRVRHRELELAEMRAERDKPEFHLDSDEYAELDDLQKSVMQELQAALDSDDIKKIDAAISKMRELGMKKARCANSQDWLAYVPKIMRQKAVESLGWFGVDGLPELVEFTGDGDPDVARSAMDLFEQAVQDFSLSDYEKADVIKMVCQAVTDEEFVDWMLMEAQDARHSVGIDTLLYVNQYGTEMAKSKVPENIEFFTGDDSIQTEADARNWLEQNPDGEDDNVFYGGVSE